MDEAELVGGVLFGAEDPVGAAARLAAVLAGGERDRDRIRRLGFEPDLVEGLRGVLPRDPRRIESACTLGAGWVLGQRAAGRRAPDGWELVATLRSVGPLPGGLQRTTAETLIALATEARHRIRLSAPFLDPVGMGYIADALAAASTRGVRVELAAPARSLAAPEAVAALRAAFAASGDPARLHLVRSRPDAPWSHLKVMVADGTSAYIGSANVTAAGLAGRNLELGVLVRGPRVGAIERILELYRE
jgi:phosphatidylserine/phosphatidylglycerophosphate/cardiolipin synthase-like enzyme